MDPDKILVQQKVERATADVGANDVFEFVLDGVAIGEKDLIPCMVESVAGDNVTVKIADGYRTGEVVSVDSRYITAFQEDFVADASKRLFR